MEHPLTLEAKVLETIYQSFWKFWCFEMWWYPDARKAHIQQH